MKTDMEPRRDQINGRYVHRDLSLVCRCGHTLGQHAATTVASRRDCFAESLDPKVGGCACERFLKAAK